MQQDDGITRFVMNEKDLPSFFLVSGLALIAASLVLPCMQMGNPQPGIVCLGVAVGVSLGAMDGFYFSDHTVWMCRIGVLLNVLVPVAAILLASRRRSLRYCGLVTLGMSFAGILYLLLSIHSRHDAIHIGMLLWTLGLSMILICGFIRSMEMGDATEE